MKRKVSLDEGEWHACTMGEFVALLVDGGDPAVLFRVTHDSEPNAHGSFLRDMEIVILPDGEIAKSLDGARSVHTLLCKLLDAGVLK
jgi:hypothetical protein